jgi:hypothetical protein
MLDLKNEYRSDRQAQANLAAGRAQRIYSRRALHFNQA